MFVVSPNHRQPRLVVPAQIAACPSHRLEPVALEFPMLHRRPVAAAGPNPGPRQLVPEVFPNLELELERRQLVHPIHQSRRPVCPSCPVLFRQPLPVAPDQVPTNYHCPILHHRLVAECSNHHLLALVVAQPVECPNQVHHR